VLTGDATAEEYQQEQKLFEQELTDGQVPPSPPQLKTE
jgi:hypothetical protein